MQSRKLMRVVDAQGATIGFTWMGEMLFVIHEYHNPDTFYADAFRFMERELEIDANSEDARTLMKQTAEFEAEIAF